MKLTYIVQSAEFLGGHGDHLQDRQRFRYTLDPVDESLMERIVIETSSSATFQPGRLIALTIEHVTPSVAARQPPVVKATLPDETNLGATMRAHIDGEGHLRIGAMRDA